jgi:formylglycine-generating enzyme required for sulfatase activity
MGGNPSQYRGDNLPVEQVSWRDVQEFIRRLNAITGKRYRLPTESEWEYAARGGSASKGYKYAGSSRVEEVAWYGRGNGTHAVGKKLPNELGVYDMSGNVCEWVNDRYGETGGDGGDRVLRGGSWSNMAKNCRVSDRVSCASGARGNYIGFRLALSQ